MYLAAFAIGFHCETDLALRTASKTIAFPGNRQNEGLVAANVPEQSPQQENVLREIRIGEAFIGPDSREKSIAIDDRAIRFDQDEQHFEDLLLHRLRAISRDDQAPRDIDGERAKPMENRNHRRRYGEHQRV
jgi:hypothetical protein